MSNNSNPNQMLISNRTLLVTCTTISMLSFFGILFLVVVISLVVSKAVELAKKYNNVKGQIQKRGQLLTDSKEFKNFQDHLVDAGQNAFESSKNWAGMEESKEEEHTY
jgi:predicted PurR-regulated permease PerM